jgi:hypothetical protein
LPIDEGMQNPTGIAVSKEEEQFLRSAFRRFALPYVLVVAAVAWIASTVMSNDAPSGSPREMSSLLEKVTALEKSVAALEGRIAKVDGEIEKAGTRVARSRAASPSPLLRRTTPPRSRRRCATPRAASPISSGAAPRTPAPPTASTRSRRGCSGSRAPRVPRPRPLRARPRPHRPHPRPPHRLRRPLRSIARAAGISEPRLHDPIASVALGAAGPQARAPRRSRTP